MWQEIVNEPKGIQKEARTTGALIKSLEGQVKRLNFILQAMKSQIIHSSERFVYFWHKEWSMGKGKTKLGCYYKIKVPVCGR